jgi:hypothetical protein
MMRALRFLERTDDMDHDEPARRRRRLIANDDRFDEAGHLGPDAGTPRGGAQARKIVLLLTLLAALVLAVSTSTLCAHGRSCDVERPVRILLGEDAGTPR